MTDRRSRPRYDIVGALWGVLELHEDACIRNVSATGALLDSPFPVALDSAQTVRLSVDGQWVAVEAQENVVTAHLGLIRAVAERDRAVQLHGELRIVVHVAPDLFRVIQKIAEELVLSIRTVERHISNIYEKIDVHGSTARAAATAYAFSQGLAQA